MKRARTVPASYFLNNPMPAGWRIIGFNDRTETYILEAEDDGAPEITGLNDITARLRAMVASVRSKPEETAHYVPEWAVPLDRRRP